MVLLCNYTHKNRTISRMPGQEINSARLMRKSADDTMMQ